MPRVVRKHFRRRRIRQIVSPGQPFLDQLYGYWVFGDATNLGLSTFVPALGSQDLTNVNSVTQVAGKIGNGAGFVAASTQYLGVADNAALSMGTGQLFTVATWFNLTSNSAGNNGLVGKWGASGEYLLTVESNRLRMYCRNAGGTTTAASTGAAAIADATWYFGVGWWDGTNVNVQLNNGTVFSTAHANGAQDAANPFNLGAFNNGGSYLITGTLDSAAVWKRVLTATERTFMFNATAGRLFRELAGYGG